MMETKSYVPEEIQAQIETQRKNKQEEYEKRCSRFEQIPGQKIKRISNDRHGSYDTPFGRWSRADFDCEQLHRLKSNFNATTEKPEAMLTFKHIGIDPREDKKRIRKQIKRILKTQCNN